MEKFEKRIHMKMDRAAEKFAGDRELEGLQKGPTFLKRDL